MVSSLPNANSTDPIFPGGVIGLQRFIKQNKHSLGVAVAGTVFVEFVVKADGTVGDFDILEGLSIEADQEALRILSRMPKWTPGTIDGTPAQFKFVLPVDF
jgi:TonB family protein